MFNSDLIKQFNPLVLVASVKLISAPAQEGLDTRFSYERRHEDDVVAHASPLLKRSTHRKQRDFSQLKKRRYIISAQMDDGLNLKKKIGIQ